MLASDVSSADLLGSRRRLLMRKLIRIGRTLGTGPLKVLKILVQRLPSDFVFEPDFTVGRKHFGRHCQLPGIMI